LLPDILIGVLTKKLYKDSRRVQEMPIQKRFLKSKLVCKATFMFPKELAGDAKRVNLVGDFNNWNRENHTMKKLKSGSFKIILDLPVGREFQYRYLIDSERWENDPEADKYIQAPYPGIDNSIIIT